MKRYRLDISEEELFYIISSIKLNRDIHNGRLNLTTMTPLTEEIYRTTRSNTFNGGTIMKLDDVSSLLEEIRVKIWGGIDEQPFRGSVISVKLEDICEQILSAVENHIELNTQLKRGNPNYVNKDSSDTGLSLKPEIKLKLLTDDIIRSENIDDILS